MMTTRCKRSVQVACADAHVVAHARTVTWDTCVARFAAVLICAQEFPAVRADVDTFARCNGLTVITATRNTWAIRKPQTAPRGLRGPLGQSGPGAVVPRNWKFGAIGEAQH